MMMKLLVSYFVIHLFLYNQDVYIIFETKGPGLFNDIIEQAKNMSVDERVELLEQSKELAQLHASAATEGQTEVCMFFMQRDKLLKKSQL